MTSEHVERYPKISGDFNPIHFDPEFAAITQFGGFIIHGDLTTGLVVLFNQIYIPLRTWFVGMAPQCCRKIDSF
ncbi:MAG: hypothetical protein JSV69_15830 [Chloroflexota bacterium]|nr:MAG: hypothetical protein JSV69_15830 [Chloroflexota bacterium]UCF27908.1 MAG: hypothetical protein JSW42_14995 [Chloroflexota bacterium]